MNQIRITNFPKEKIYILLSKNYRKFLVEKSMNKLECKNYFNLSLWLNKKFKIHINGGDIKYFIEGKRLDKRTGKIHPKFIPLSWALELVKLIKGNLENLEKNIIAYRSSGNGLIINKPVFPINITPELDSIVIHMFGDGAAGDFTPSYTQKNIHSFNNFIKKLKNCFGEFQKSIYFTQGKHQIKFPKAITDIISYYYSIQSYKTHKSKIPDKILKRKNTDFKLASIVAFIVDEGYVRDLIVLYSSNKELLKDIRELILDCGYPCSDIQYNKKAGGYLINLSNKNIKRFYEDMQKLCKKFPTCNLSFKEKEVKFIIKRKNKKNPKNSKYTDKRIIGTLKKGKFSAQQISKINNYAYCTILHHLEDLYKKKLVKRERIVSGTYLWSLS